ncbi:MAG: hypothetical protein F6J98_47390 [Moorea sp. SIO4G2]|nr:hypothetical protein [Moorena sp. SIO4G2]
MKNYEVHKIFSLFPIPCSLLRSRLAVGHATRTHSVGFGESVAYGLSP